MLSPKHRISRPGMLAQTVEMRTSRGAMKALFFAVAIAPCLARADLEITHSTRCEVTISGEITAQDAEKLASSVCPSPFILLNDSPGGDVRAGMKIGRWIREHEGPTSVEKDQYCYSTCALVFIAGIERFNLGVIGLHRLYLTGAPQPKETIPALVSAMRDAMREYVSEMGARPEFASVMLETLPEQMRLYREAEIHELVAERDAVYDEVEAARNARFYGVPTDEFRRRRQEADEECNISKFIDRLSDFTPEIGIRYETCERAVLWGLTQSVYLARIASIPTRCDHLAKRNDPQPFIECRIAVMSGQ